MSDLFLGRIFAILVFIYSHTQRHTHTHTFSILRVFFELLDGSRASFVA